MFSAVERSSLSHSRTWYSETTAVLFLVRLLQEMPQVMNAAVLFLFGTAATATAAAPAVGKVATACGIQYTTVNDAWRAIGNECCSDMNDNGRCLGPNVTDRSGWLIPTPNKTAGFKNMGDAQGTAQ